MTNPHQPDPNLPAAALSGSGPRRPSYATGATSTAAPNFMNHPARTSVISQLLNRTADMTSDSTAQHRHYSSIRSPDGDHERYGTRSNAGSVRHEDGAMQAQFGTISRAFELFAHGARHDDPLAAEQDGFFIPSYLRDTTYARKLRVCTRRKALASQQAKPSQGTTRTTGGASAVGAPATNGPSLSTKTVTTSRAPLDRRGAASSAEDKSETPPLPAKWNKDDKCPHGLDVMGERQLEVRHTTQGKGTLDYETASIRADHAVPPECGLYYFEVTILAGKSQEYVLQDTACRASGC
jgi:Ran-binding protein 9/10